MPSQIDPMQKEINDQTENLLRTLSKHCDGHSVPVVFGAAVNLAMSAIGAIPDAQAQSNMADLLTKAADDARKAIAARQH